MRITDTDEIYGLKNEILSRKYFLEHIPERYFLLCNLIHHVDTQLKVNSEQKHWRVQGYLEKEDMQILMKDGTIKFDAYICFSDNKLEIWSLSVPFKK